MDVLISGKKCLISTLMLFIATNVFGWKGELLSGSNVGAELEFSSDGTYEWTWDSTNKRLQSSNNGVDNSTSSSIISFSTNAESTLSFNYGVSSETNFDKLTITLDGTTIIDRISGIVSNRYTRTLPQGNHKLVVSYTKDSSQSSNADIAYISDLWCAVYSGTTGDMTWSVNGESLTISGSGSMSDSYSVDFYDNIENSLAPWYCFRKVIKNLSISNQCTRITDFAFYGMQNVTSITIPASVTSIGMCAFAYCNPANLRFEDSENRLDISSWVDGCPDNDWSYCPIYVFYGAENIYVGRNVSAGGFSASSLNYRIKNLQIGKMVTDASILPLITSSSCNIVLDSENPYLTIVDDVMYNAEKTMLYKVLPKKTGAVIVPASVTTICAQAAESNQNLTSLHLSGAVAIQSYAFLGCTNLKYVDVGSSITSVGNYVFSCYDDSDEYYYDISGMTFNYHNLQGYCESVVCSSSAVNLIANQNIPECIGEELIIPEGTTRILADKFNGFERIKSVTFPNSLQTIGNNAFHGCTGLTTVTIPSGVTSLGGNSFGLCNLSTIRSYPVEVPTSYSSPFNGTNIATATLYVASESVEKYKTASYWKDFGNIFALDAPTPDDPSEDPSDNLEPSTDVSIYTNALYFNDVESRPGDFDLALNMKCAAENITAFQCDVYLPEGVEWKSTTDRRGNIIYDKPAFNEDRTDESYHTIDVAKNDDGSYNIIVYSMDLANILETDGTIMTLPLTISEDMEKKDYNIFLKKIVLTDVNEQQTLIDKMVSKLTIPSYKLGDANGDNLINVTDVVSTIGYIRGKAGNNFVFGAADVNEDTQINVTDIVGIIRLIRSGARNMPAKKPHVHKVIR